MSELDITRQAHVTQMLQAVCQLLDMNREHAAAAEHGSLRTWMMTMKTAYFHKTHDSAHELCVKTKKKKNVKNYIHVGSQS